MPPAPLPASDLWPAANHRLSSLMVLHWLITIVEKRKVLKKEAILSRGDSFLFILRSSRFKYKIVARLSAAGSKRRSWKKYT